MGIYQNYMDLKNYLKSFWKYYILRKPKLILTIILTIVVYIWVCYILNEINSAYITGGWTLRDELVDEKEYAIHTLENFPIAVILYFVKPIFVYISGLVIIKNV